MGTLVDRALGSLLALSGGGLPDPLPSDPFALLAEWMQEAERIGVADPNAMALATAGPDGTPSVRMVLGKRLDAGRGSIDVFSDLRSRKAIELTGRPRVAATMHWDRLGRQCVLEGTAARLDDEECDRYFVGRPLLAKLGAWATRRTTTLASRGELAAAVLAEASRLRIDPAALLRGESGVQVPRPPHWGGFRITLARVELWIGGGGRLHDRAEWRRVDAAWQGQRLWP
jgi:pyridoxamine 5'-phosphate oxidase